MQKCDDKVKYFSGGRVHSGQNTVSLTMLFIYPSYVHSLLITRVCLFIDLFEFLYRYRNKIKQSKQLVKWLHL